MANKVRVRICVGTSCFVMGAAQIQSLEFNAPSDIADYIEIIEERCMNLCKEVKTKYNSGPFVWVNDELVEEATYEKVVNKIREEIKKSC
ncbi:MAG: hypothetical protein IJW72_05885 [Alphaproteobacteria bacterium]|nr:hypothetical protein [Alphaproteobacteria bacterium]MBQ7285763.1 hypothetical protein [Alphaproteobacteria bacterium]